MSNLSDMAPGYRWLSATCLHRAPAWSLVFTELLCQDGLSGPSLYCLYGEGSPSRELCGHEKSSLRSSGDGGRWSPGVLRTL